MGLIRFMSESRSCSSGVVAFVTRAMPGCAVQPFEHLSPVVEYLFMGKARCVVCHKGSNLTDNGFHNLAVPDDHVTSDAKVMASVRFDAKRLGMEKWAELTEDPGREGVTKAPVDRGKFRTMGLRNIAQSPPYMHNGALETLEDVVAFYNKGGGDHPNKSPLMRPLGLTDGEQADLVAFLNALTGSQRAMDLK